MARWEKEKIRIVLVLAISFLGFGAFSQKPRYIQPGLLSASATLSPAIMLNRNETNYYVSGFFEGKMTKHLSFRGDAYYMLGNVSTKFLKNNIRTFIGLQYGYSFGNFELHTGFAPGFAFMQSNVNPSITEFAPSLQVNLGMRFYVWKYFHFFANFSYIHARMQNLEKINGMADEFVISVGLGFNLQTLKKYRNIEE